jgi:hypothetical protein
MADGKIETLGEAVRYFQSLASSARWNAEHAVNERDRGFQEGVVATFDRVLPYLENLLRKGMR